MNKEEIVKALKEDPELLLGVCKDLDLYLPYENIDVVKNRLEELENFKKTLKEILARFEKRTDLSPEERENLINKCRENLLNCDKEITYLKDRYDVLLMNLEFNKEYECRWLPDYYTERARDIFDFRKEMYHTQAIYEDMILNEMIANDISTIYNEVGGQDGMYDNFPFTRKFEAEGDKPSRIYALSGAGGLALIGDKQIVTLGEDDGYLFLNGRCIYENFYREDDFEECLKLITEEYFNKH